MHLLVIPRTQGSTMRFFSEERRSTIFLMSSVRKLKLKYTQNQTSEQYSSLSVTVGSNFSKRSDKEFQKTRKLAEFYFLFKSVEKNKLMKISHRNKEGRSYVRLTLLSVRSYSFLYFHYFIVAYYVLFSLYLT